MNFILTLRFDFIITIKQKDLSYNSYLIKNKAIKFMDH